MNQKQNLNLGLEMILSSYCRTKQDINMCLLGTLASYYFK